MATVINTEKQTSAKQPSRVTKAREQKPPLFRKMNYILMIVGITILILGYILLSGGKAPSDDVFNEAIFDPQRLVVAPTLILIGLVTGIVAIMYHPKTKSNAKKVSEETNM